MIARAAEHLATAEERRAEHWPPGRVCKGLLRAFGLLPFVAIYSPVVGELRVVNVAGTRVERESIVAHRLLEAAGRYLGRGSERHLACLKWLRGRTNGLTNTEVANQFGVTLGTLKLWRVGWCGTISVGIERDGLWLEKIA